MIIWTGLPPNYVISRIILLMTPIGENIQNYRPNFKKSNKNRGPKLVMSVTTPSDKVLLYNAHGHKLRFPLTHVVASALQRSNLPFSGRILSKGAHRLSGDCFSLGEHAGRSPRDGASRDGGRDGLTHTYPGRKCRGVQACLSGE
jgi:hypothetical protein